LLHLAAAFHQAHLVEFLLDKKLDPNHKDRDGFRPLMKVFAISGFATSAKRVEDTARVLIKAGADPTARDADSQTVLHRVAVSSLRSDLVTLDVVRFLIDSGADPGVVDEFGASAGDLARKKRREKLALLLESRVKTRWEVQLELQAENAD
jgi:ankyrin repeat protein